MPYSKLYNPEKADVSLTAGGVAVTIPGRGYVIVEANLAEELHQMMVSLERVPASDEEYSAFEAAKAPAPAAVPARRKRTSLKKKKGA